MSIDKAWLTVVLTFTLITSVACSRQTSATNHEVAPAPLFSSDNPQSIYAADPNDSWNRIFRALFTRTVKARLSSDFPEGAPFIRFRARMGSFDLRVSKEKISRTEIGDRAIEPLYPTFLTQQGPIQVFSEPLFSELTNALGAAIHEARSRSIVERALMQSDVWAAYDIIYATGRGREEVENFGERKALLLNLLAQFIRKLALTSDQIKSLNDNYLTSVTRKGLPNVFSPDSGWLEIQLLDHRSHDFAAGFRRAARVFIKPRSAPADPGVWVEKLKLFYKHLEEIEAVALLVQNLLIDSSWRAVPSPLFSEAQFRFFKIDAKTGTISADAKQNDLSRKLLLTDPLTGGFEVIDQKEPAYMTQAGNDYGFATSIDEAEAPIVVPMRTRCSQCHDKSLTTLMTYSIHNFPPVPTAKVLNSAAQERALYVARVKESRDDFKSLSVAR